jgi:hypothetical protein
MWSSGKWRHVGLVRTNVLGNMSSPSSEQKKSVSLEKLAVISRLILSIPKMEATLSSKTLVLTRLTWCHMPDDGIFIITIKATSILT